MSFTFVGNLRCVAAIVSALALSARCEGERLLNGASTVLLNEQKKIIFLHRKLMRFTLTKLHKHFTDPHVKNLQNELKQLLLTFVHIKK